MPRRKEDPKAAAASLFPAGLATRLSPLLHCDVLPGLTASSSSLFLPPPPSNSSQHHHHRRLLFDRLLFCSPYPLCSSQRTGCLALADVHASARCGSRRTRRWIPLGDIARQSILGGRSVLKSQNSHCIRISCFRLLVSVAFSVACTSSACRPCFL